MHTKEQKNHKKRNSIIAIVLILVIIGVALFVFYSNKISTSGNLLGSIARVIPGVESVLQGEEEGRINVLLLGMRGENVPGGGLLADTIMIASIRPDGSGVSLVSIPRDLYVTVPNTQSKQKINSVYFYGEEAEKDGGIHYMKQVTGEITGLPIHYAVVTNFQGFVELVDSLGGVPVTLEEPFIEPIQYHEERVCDEHTFTVPSGNYDIKRNEKGKIVAQYPLCYNANEECGGVFQVPAGTIVMDGATALCYVRARVTSSDFDRARRQQEVLSEIQSKAFDLGTLTDFSKISGIVNALGNNIKTDMEIWEMKRFLELFGGVRDTKIEQRVLENSEEGLLYAPEETNGAGYILLPRGNSYEAIGQMMQTLLPENTSVPEGEAVENQ